MAKKEVALPIEPPVEGMLPIKDMQICRTCHAELPLTEEFYHRDKMLVSGFRTQCCTCRAEEKRRVKNTELIEKVGKLDERAMALLDCVLEDDKGTLTPHMMEVFEAMTYCYGGAMGFAKHQMANYLMAKPGSAIRQRYDMQYVRFAHKATETGMAKKKYDDMTEEELNAEAKKLAKRSLRAYREPIDVVPTPHTDSEGQDGLKNVS